jgi:REP element-mobilizing transposase RayT
MPRLARSSFPAHGVWHVTTRGVEQREVYLDRDDGLSFLTQLWRAVERFELRALALCLMPNHYHFVVECGRDRLSRALHRVNGIYAQGFNAKYDRSGHLWVTASRSGRFGTRSTCGPRASTWPQIRCEHDCASSSPTGRGAGTATRRGRRRRGPSRRGSSPSRSPRPRGSRHRPALAPHHAPRVRSS